MDINQQISNKSIDEVIETINLLKDKYKDNVKITNIINKLDDNDNNILLSKLLSIFDRDSYMIKLKHECLICSIMGNELIENFHNMGIPELTTICKVLIDICKKINILDYLVEDYLLGDQNFIKTRIPTYLSYREKYLMYKKELDILVSLEFQDVPKVFTSLFPDVYRLNILIQNLPPDIEDIFIKCTTP